jgi:hypothetical protein
MGTSKNYVFIRHHWSQIVVKLFFLLRKYSVQVRYYKVKKRVLLLFVSNGDVLVPSITEAKNTGFIGIH